MRIALIAHDKKKDDMVALATEFKEILKDNQLYATGTTGGRIIDATGLDVHRFKSGPLGGDQQIGAAISNNQMDLVIFLRDPLTPQAHEPDISALLRLCDVYEIPLATNDSSARIMIQAVEKGLINWREAEHGEDWKQLDI
ncbi:methylglyoxal synthase [Aerococcaceae bacterium DSM 111020]|nr:methylglyoxal synthase [Aerococcaceae bacterium DSM 111020]